MDKIDEAFPLDEYRPGQKEAIQAILDAFETHDFVLLEAPTGSGKSAIGFTLMQLFEKSFYLAPQKFLMNQLSVDFGVSGKCIGKHSPMIELKGRSNYECDFYHTVLKDHDYDCSDAEHAKFSELSNRYIDCSCGECKRKSKSKLEYCSSNGICQYFNQLASAKSSKCCLMNYHSFLYQMMTTAFDPRDLLILDEAHCTESVLMGFIELSISDRYFQSERISFPQLETAEKYIKYFEEIKLRELMENKRRIALAMDDFKEYDNWNNMVRNYDYLVNSDLNNWVCQWEEVKSGMSRKIIIRPIFIDGFAKRYLFGYASKTLMMSATLLSKKVICDSLGIEDAKFLKLPNLFPLKNRPIVFRPSGSMAYKSKSETMPKMIEDINAICNKHKDVRGIIHTHSFDIAEKIVKGCDPSVSERFVYQKDVEFSNNKDKVLAKHLERHNSIIVAPAMHEGLDLAGDLGVFQFILKVPYPSLMDPQIKARMEISQLYYNWLTMCKLIQSCGRIIRHKDDYGVTYVLDADFKSFYDRSGGLMPKWFKDAIKW